MSAPCAACQRPIAGDSVDPMVCVVDPVDGPLTFCTPCYTVEPRKLGWTEWRAGVPDDAMLQDSQGMPLGHTLKAAEVGS